VVVRFGKPVDIEDYFGREDEEGVLEELMRQCLREIARMAGRPDFEPEYAGRQWKSAESN
jgi:hypothetical protein